MKGERHDSHPIRMAIEPAGLEPRAGVVMVDCTVLLVAKESISVVVTHYRGNQDRLASSSGWEVWVGFTWC